MRTIKPIYSYKSHVASPFKADVRVTVDIRGHVRRDWYKSDNQHLKCALFKRRGAHVSPEMLSRASAVGWV
jgi:hypothetical protein